jgi:hypothetical protein
MTDRRRATVRPGDTTRSRASGGASRAARGYAGNGGSSGDEAPDGVRLGPIPITATGVLLAIALIGSLVFFLFTITVREASQIPMLAASLVVLGLVFAAIAIVGGRATWRSSVGGRDARAFAHALVGGISALVAAGCFSGAVILFLIQGR